MKFILISLIYLVELSRSLPNKCFSDPECNKIWPGAVCSRSRCRCPSDTVRRKCSSREFVCLSLVDITTGEAGPPLTCPLPEGAGYQVALRNNSNPVFCSSSDSHSVCPEGYECIQGFGIYDTQNDGICCPNKSATCSHPIFDNEDGTLVRWGFDGNDCVQFRWNPNRPSTANVFRTRDHCQSYCVKSYHYFV